MPLTRNRMLAITVVVCVMALLVTLISFLMTQMTTNTYSNVDPESLGPMSSTSQNLLYEDGAELVEITLTYDTDDEFDVWLVDDAAPGDRPSPFGIDSWVRHGVAGTGDIEWTVSADEYDGTLRIFEENSYIGERGSLFGGSTVTYDRTVRTRSVFNPMESYSTWVVLGFVVLAVILLAWAMVLPREVVRDFSELYPELSGR